MNKNGFLYVVTMYRYASKEDHSYVLGVYDNPNEAIKHGKVEELWRGNKYTCEVLRLKLNDTTNDFDEIILSVERNKADDNIAEMNFFDWCP